MIAARQCPSFDKPPSVGYTYRLLTGSPGLLPSPAAAQPARINGQQIEDPDRGGNRQDAEVGIHEPGPAQVLPRAAAGAPAPAARERGGHDRAPARALLRAGP